MRLPKPSNSTAEFTVPDAGVYKMEFTDYDEPAISQYKKKNGDDQWRIKMVFTIRDDDDYEGEEIWAWYGWSMHPKAKLYPIIKALLGREIEEDDEPDLDDLVGKHIMGTLDNVTKTTENGTRTYANLIAASPVRKAKVKPVTAPRTNSLPSREEKIAEARAAVAVEDDPDAELWDDEPALDLV
jgi:hypothetical protein